MQDNAGLYFINKSMGAILHEILHCVGVQHPGQPNSYAETMTAEKYGDDGWRTPMSAHWNFPKDNQGVLAKLLPEEIQYVKTVHFFS